MSNKYPVRPEQAEELVSELYKKSSVEEPGEALDNAILNQAYASVEETKTAHSQSFTHRVFRWQRYASIAASLVIAVTIGMIYTDNTSELLPESALVVPQLSEEYDRVSGQAERIETEPESLSLEEAAKEPEVNGTALDDAYDASAGSVMSSPATSSMADEGVTIEMVPAKEASKKLEKKKSFEVRSLMAPAPMLKQKTASTSERNQRIDAIRNAIKEDDLQKADQLWKAFLIEFSKEQAPEDLLRFFGEDF